MRSRCSPNGIVDLRCAGEAWSGYPWLYLIDESRGERKERRDYALGGSAISLVFPEEASQRSALEIELDLQAVRIVDEDLHRAVARHDGLAERNAGGVSCLPRRFDVHAVERDVIQPAGSRFTRVVGCELHQMHDRDVAEIEPVASRGERRTIADAQAESTHVEIARAIGSVVRMLTCWNPSIGIVSP